MNLRPPGYEPGELTGLLHAASGCEVIIARDWAPGRGFLTSCQSSIASRRIDRDPATTYHVVTVSGSFAIDRTAARRDPPWAPRSSSSSAWPRYSAWLLSQSTSCGWLSSLAAHRPTVIGGTWDFVGLVGGLSGFVLFGGGLVLSLFQSNFRYWMRGNFESLRAAWGQEKVTWTVLAALYLLVVVAWIALALAARRRSLVVYNIDPAVFEATLVEIFEQLNQPVERRGNLWVSGVPLVEVDRFRRRANGHVAVGR